MTARDPAPRQKKGVLLSLVVGALLVPLAAYAASSLVSDAAVPTTVSAPTTTAPAAEVAAAASSADIALACGEEGMRLVAAESDGTISDVQQAALDALRDICVTEGSPLPAPTISAAPSTPSTVVVQATTSVTAPDDDDHGGHGGGDDDDDDHGGRHGRDGDDDHDDDRVGDDD